MLKRLSLKIYLSFLILLSLIVLVLFMNKGILGLNIAAAFLMFTVLCLAAIYGFAEKLEKEILSLILSTITLFVVLHYVICASTFNVEYYSIFLLRTCKDSKCSIVLDWGQLFLISITLIYIAMNIIRKAKRI